MVPQSLMVLKIPSPVFMNKEHNLKTEKERKDFPVKIGMNK